LSSNLSFLHYEICNSYLKKLSYFYANFSYYLIKFNNKILLIFPNHTGVEELLTPRYTLSAVQILEHATFF